MYTWHVRLSMTLEGSDERLTNGRLMVRAAVLVVGDLGISPNVFQARRANDLVPFCVSKSRKFSKIDLVPFRISKFGGTTQIRRLQIWKLHCTFFAKNIQNRFRVSPHNLIGRVGRPF